MSAAQATSAHGVGDVVTVTDPDDVRSQAPARAHRAAAPGPAVLRDQATAARAEGVPLAVGKRDRRRVVDEDLAFELGGCRGCLKAKSQGRRDRGEAAGARDERIDHGRATHRTSILMSRIGCPSSSRKRTQKSLSPGPLITAPRRTLRPSWRVRRSDSTSSITILRSSNSSATTSPFNHHRDAELEPTASRTSRISRGLSITVTAQNTTPYFGLPRAWAKLNSFTSHSFESRACQRSG